MRRNKFRRKGIAVFLALAIVITSVPAYKHSNTSIVKAATETYTSGDYGYTLNNENEATLVSYTGTASSLVIPDYLDGHSVVGLGNNLFKNNKTLESLQMPNTLTTIGYSILYGTKGVKEIAIPKSVKKMNAAFGGEGPFAGSGIEKAVFEDGIEYIPANALRNCENLKEVVIPESAQSVQSCAFRNCTNLTEVKLPDSMTAIEDNAFANTSLSELKLPKKMEDIGYSILYGTKGVKEITIPKSVKKMNAAFGGEGPFAGSGIEKAVFEER